MYLSTLKKAAKYYKIKYYTARAIVRNYKKNGIVHTPKTIRNIEILIQEDSKENEWNDVIIEKKIPRTELGFEKKPEENEKFTEMKSGMNQPISVDFCHSNMKFIEARPMDYNLGFG